MSVKAPVLSYAERAQICTHPLSRSLLSLMEEKQSNLSVAIDVTSKEKLLALAEQLGPEICVLKTHVDIIEDFDLELIQRLQQLSSKHQFLIFEDRKFADIGKTVQMQYSKGIYRISDWAHMINAHSVPGPGIIQGLKEEGLQKGRGLLLLAEMSSEGNLLQGSYTQATVEMALQSKDFVMGFISQKKLCDDPEMLYLTPGVSLSRQGDALGQRYLTPESAILHRHSDVVIVGRGITQSQDPALEALRYRKESWQAYRKRLQ